MLKSKWFWISLLIVCFAFIPIITFTVLKDGIGIIILAIENAFHSLKSIKGVH